MEYFGTEKQIPLRKCSSAGASFTAETKECHTDLRTKGQRNLSRDALTQGLSVESKRNLEYGSLNVESGQGTSGFNTQLTGSISTGEPTQAEKQDSSIQLQTFLSADLNRRCWICYACEEDEDAPDDELVNPCGCKGSTKWVHQMCINKWIDEVQGGNASKEIRCPYCKNLFAYVFPTASFFYRALATIDTCYTHFCKTVSEGQIVGMLSFAAIASGAAEVFKKQLKHLLPLLKDCDHGSVQQLIYGALLQFAVPTSLIIMQQHLSSLEDRLAASISSSDSSTTDLRILEAPLQDADLDGANGINQIVAALIFPMVSESLGSLLYGSIIKSKFHCYLAGSLTYIFGRGLVKIVYKRKQLSLQRKRRVLNWSTREVATTAA